ncbi:fimbrial protein [Dyella sp. ASV21]|uniref:fimbrial protein n=1 Tax=Dyella sp. ASV21 TaxID=2795114 RepID=UPI0018EDB88B|nr:fimbrial protein [Dyella sp. ASV21]
MAYIARLPRPTQVLLGWILLLCLGLVPRHALAATCTVSPSGATLTVPAVTVTTGTATGTKLGTPGTLSVTFSCTGLPSGQTATLQVGNLAPRDASDPPPGGGISFATNVPGIAFVLTASPIQASDNSCLRCGPGQTPGWEAANVTSGQNSSTVTFTGQLMKTGAVTPGTVSSVQLAQFWWYIYGSTSSVGPIGSLTLNSTTVNVQACSVNSGSTNFTVTLPTVSTQALRSAAAVAGRTGFAINLTCQAGANVYITMAASSGAGTATGTLVSTGTAGKVQVQLLDKSFNPVVFNTATALGAAPTGTLSIPYYAQYYATGAATAGSVNATATFTMSYQ